MMRKHFAICEAGGVESRENYAGCPAQPPGLLPTSHPSLTVQNEISLPLVHIPLVCDPLFSRECLTVLGKVQRSVRREWMMWQILQNTAEHFQTLTSGVSTFYTAADIYCA